jgi:multidrug resistance efflux pump
MRSAASLSQRPPAATSGDRAEIKLMGYPEIVRGHIDSIARAINVANAQPNGQGVANVNPIFTWVRLAQRFPVRIHIDEVPEGVVLAAGMTATVQIDIFSRPTEPGQLDQPGSNRTQGADDSFWRESGQ